MKNPELSIAFMLVGVPLILALVFGLPALFMALWNWMMPNLVALPELTYWQCFGILPILSIIATCCVIRA